MNIDTPLLLVGDLNWGEGDCDCACSTAPFGIESHFQQASTFTTVPNAHIDKLGDGFWLAFSPFAPAGPCVLNETAWQRYQQFAEQPYPLTQPIDQQFVKQNLIAPIDQKIQVIPTQTDQLVVWLHITNACNLDCPYCYVQKSSARMTEDIGKTAIEKIVQTAKINKLKKIKLKYAGGEATLHFKLVRLLHTYSHQLAAEHNLTVDEVLLSNGVFLKPQMADWLAATQMKLMISLDGVSEVHDQQRPMKNGGNTFAQIEKNIDEVLLPRGIRPHISVTITGLNAKNIAQTIEWVLQRDLPLNLNFYRENHQSLSYTHLRIEEELIIEGMREAYRTIERYLPTRPLLNNILDKMITQAHTHTCGVGQNYLVITHQGHLSQCQMHLDTPVSENPAADLLLPLIAKGPVQNLSVDEKAGCQNCSFRYRCTGGCPIETYQATGRWDVQSPHCNIYKTLYPEALRLEGLRLLKTHQATGH